ncbi:MAG TPA: hypothetical protein VFD23_04835, partial [Clostridia bacterium]|nr:hypothetical protein [Clostridia bacterium]
EYVTPSFNLAGLEDDFVPQGVCYVDELEAFAVSGYVDGDISRIYLVDPQTNTSKRINLLGYKGHAGGIASRGKDIWVSSSYQVYHLSTDAIKDAPDTITIPFDGSFKSEVKGSFLCCSDDMLWVGEFYNKDYDVKESHACGKNRAWAAGYKISSNIHPNNGKPEQADVILSIPDEIQGMSITDEGYVLLSSSYGRTNDSKLYIYDAYENWAMDEDKGVYFPRWRNNVGKLKMPTLMEGMDYHNDRLFIAFESGAQKYSDAKEIIEYAWEVDINTIIKDLKKCSLRTAFSIL